MGRMTKREEGLIVESFYGIDPKTFEVERVSLTKGNDLRKMGRNLQSYTHSILHGRDPRTEIIIVWHLSDIISFREGVFTDEQIKEGVERLKVLAEERKAAAQPQ
jgi:hypothetical protein